MFKGFKEFYCGEFLDGNIHGLGTLTLFDKTYTGLWCSVSCLDDDGCRDSLMLVGHSKTNGTLFIDDLSFPIPLSLEDSVTRGSKNFYCCEYVRDESSEQGFHYKVYAHKEPFTSMKHYALGCLRLNTTDPVLLLRWRPTP